MSDFHEHLYGDPKRVHAARVQAEGRIGARRIKQAMLDVVEPLLLRIVSRLER
jgi:uncharacterized cysteine cluster protein YcgN (CxxCxxCC family)